MTNRLNKKPIKQAEKPAPSIPDIASFRPSNECKDVLRAAIGITGNSFSDLLNTCLVRFMPAHVAKIMERRKDPLKVETH